MKSLIRVLWAIEKDLRVIANNMESRNLNKQGLSIDSKITAGVLAPSVTGLINKEQQKSGRLKGARIE